MGPRTRRKVLAAVGTSLSLSGCTKIVPSSSEGTEPTTKETSESAYSVNTHSEPTFVGIDFPLSLEKEVDTVDELASGSIVLVSPNTSLSGRKLVDCVCSGSLVIFVGPESGEKMEETLDEGNARRCLPYATEGRSGAIVAGFHPLSGELVTHYYGSPDSNTQQYKYTSTNDLILYFISNN